jgi:hypothetical protein
MEWATACTDNAHLLLLYWGFSTLYNFGGARASDVPFASYFIARTTIDVLMGLSLPTKYVLILYWMDGLDLRPASFLLSLRRQRAAS